MPNKMLIDATHPEETRVVVLRGNRVEEFDFESANRKQLRGNIYLAKVTRVEPSLQAAFVDYGGNRHGFLAFSEIHPDYYQIPVADRQALIAEEERAHRAADDEADHRAGRRHRRHRNRGAERPADAVRSEPLNADEPAREAAESPAGEQAISEPGAEQFAPDDGAMPAAEPAPEHFDAEERAREAAEVPAGETDMDTRPAAEDDTTGEFPPPSGISAAAPENGNGNGAGDEPGEDEAVESVGGADALDEAQDRQERMPRMRRQYKIQEVIKRRQVMLVQVVKEERGSKGAALTTYLSLAGRYSVLMPNTARGGGISRKITSGEDRSRLKEIAQDMEVPEGMGVILRTAGASRTKAEVKRDFEYLLRLWETVRDLTLKSTAPTLVYEEGSLTKRSIRDLYNKDIDEIIVAGEEGYKDAKEFMRMLMPSHAKNVKHYRDSQPVFTRFGIESQLDAMFSPVVQLRSGGYIVINQAEALVAIDVNSGRATREHHIEDTAVKTNSEAAEEIARQLRLRDLAGLIVIDFIDMDESRNNRTVERRMKESLRHDRARIQVGRISHFGLLEMSRQRIRTSVLESSTEKCPTCGGSGHVRSVSSVTLALLRAIEEMLGKDATHNLIVRTRAEVALYILNQKRGHLRALEERFRITITVSADPTVTATQSFVIDRGETVHTVEAARLLAAAQSNSLVPFVEEEEEPVPDEIDAEAEVATAAEPPNVETIETVADEAPDSGERESTPPRVRRRRRGGRGRSGEVRAGREPAAFVHDTVPEHIVAHEDHDAGMTSEDGFAPQPPRQGAPVRQDTPERQGAAAEGENGEVRRRRRRGRRGGRRNRQGRNGEAPLPSGDMPANEPNLEHGAADFDRPPAAARDSTPAYSLPRDSAPPYSPPRAEPAAEQDAPRRRSTIREPAPFAPERAAAPSPAPAAAPVVSSTAAEQPAPPKRGWWGKKLLGDN